MLTPAKTLPDSAPAPLTGITMMRSHVVELAAPILLFATLVSLGGLFINNLKQQQVAEVLERTEDLAQTQATVFELNLSRSISAARILGSYVELQEGRTDDFDHHAAIIHASLGGITNLQLAPDGIVQQIYPLSGHERAIGHNLLKDDERRHEADLAIRIREMTLAGPFQLVQGGIAVVARNPVFIRSDSPYLETANSGSLRYAREGDQQFWGYASVLIYFDEILAMTQLPELDEQGYQYQLWRFHPDTGAREVMSGSKALNDRFSVTRDIQLPNSTWHLTVAQQGNPFNTRADTVYWASNLGFALLLAAWTNNLLRRPRQLQKEVAARTAQLEQAQAALRLSATAFESHEAIAITDLQGKTLKVNQAFTRITGYSAEDVAGKPLPAWGNHTQRCFILEHLIHHINWEGEVSQQRRNGESYPAWLSVSAVQDEQLNTSHYVSHFIDITQRKRAEQELQHAKERAEAGNRAKSDFLAMMSHEIRTPLNGVLGLIDLARDKSHDATQRHYLNTAHQSGEALMAIINDVLDISKIEAGRLELTHSTVAPTELLQQLRNLFEPQARTQGVDFNVQQQGTLPSHFGGDPGRLRQVLLNLVGNAFKFTPSGAVALTIHGTPLQTGRYLLRFEVSDTGIGIASADLGRLFERFTSLDQQHGAQRSTGLGLTISRQLLELMGSTLHVTSTLGEGSCFSFTLEVEARQVSTSSAPNDSPQSRPAAEVELLVVEDVPVNQLVAKEMLRAAGYQVTLASNGREAVELASRRQFSAILMDLSMPEMDGLEATRAIRCLPEPFNQVPIIAMTAHALTEELDRTIKAGMNDYLTKPLNRDELISKVKDNSI